jgi:HK97 gp10 family phage protein
MKLSLKVEGGAQLSKRLQELPQAVSNRMLRAALMEAGEPIRRAASAKAPRRPGAPDIAENIRIRPARVERPNDVAVVIGPTTGFYYGFFLEYGTTRMQAQPFLRPAFEENVTQVINTMTAAIWRALIGRGYGASAFTRGEGQVL